MNRRDFLKSAALMAAAGSVLGKGSVLNAAVPSAGKPAGPVLNFNPQMQYRPMGRTGVNVSALGFGLLRLPMLADGKTVNSDLSVAMIHRAIEGGVNYIDTGRVYLGGQSEAVAGRALKGTWRDRVYVTSKSPWWIMEKPEDFEKFFDESRRTMGCDVIDFYHIHMIMHRGWNEKVIPFKLIDKIMKLKEQGKIRFAGFSFHDRLELFKEVVESAPWDFCLIQHNYLDYEYEAGCLGPKYAAANGMGLAVMKPVRTGLLAHLPPSMREALRSTGIEWALDYLWDIPEVSVAVSGMGAMADVEANLRYASKAKPNMLTPDERKALGSAICAFRETPGHIDCTGCYQCIPCPHNVAIGYIFAYVYNNYLVHRDKKRAIADYTVAMSPIQRGAPASACVNCGECLAKCPQKLNIPELLGRVRRELEG